MLVWAGPASTDTAGS